MVWFAVEAVDKDDVDQSPADGSINLCEAVTTDLWSSRSCLEKVSTGGEGSHTWQAGKRKLTIMAMQTVTLKSSPRRQFIFATRI